MPEAKKGRLARKLANRIRYLRFTDLDDAALFTATADRMPDFKALKNAAEPSNTDSLVERLPDLRHYAVLLTGVR